MLDTASAIAFNCYINTNTAQAVDPEREMRMDGKTHFADDATLEYIAEMERLLLDFVTAYDLMPDGPLGHGLTNGHFLRAKRLLVTHGLMTKEAV